MPILIIYGVPTETDQGTLKVFSELMRQTVADVDDLKLTKEQVSVFFPRDLMPEGLGEEIIIFVDGLLEKPDRTESVMKKLVSNLVNEAHLSFPKAELIECFVRSHDARNGYCTGKLHPDGGFWGEFE